MVKIALRSAEKFSELFPLSPLPLYPSAILGSEIPQPRNLSIEEFLGSGVPGHPRVVNMQGWFLAGPKDGDEGIFLVNLVLTN